MVLMPEVKVAIVIANYNTGHFVCDAIKSALAQDYSAKGVFIVDDCSTDNSLKVIGDLFPNMGSIDQNEYYVLFEGNENGIPVYLFSLKKNVGRGQVRNFPIACALNNGYHLVQILDSDDIMYPNKISELAKVMLEDPEHIGLVYADYIILNEETQTTHYESKPTFDWLKMRQGLSMVHSGALVNGAALAKVGLYRGELSVAEDMDLFLRITNTFLAINVPYPLTVVKSHSQDSTHSVPKEQWQRDFQRAMSGV
jgi:glycosyltransferase involved in cell wall biosynthesis